MPSCSFYIHTERKQEKYTLGLNMQLITTRLCYKIHVQSLLGRESVWVEILLWQYCHRLQYILMFYIHFIHISMEATEIEQFTIVRCVYLSVKVS